MMFSYDLNVRFFLPRKNFLEELGRFEILKDPWSILVRFMNFVEVYSCCGNIACIKDFGMKNKLYIKILQRISFILGFGIT